MLITRTWTALQAALQGIYFFVPTPHPCTPFMLMWVWLLHLLHCVGLPVKRVLWLNATIRLKEYGQAHTHPVVPGQHGSDKPDTSARTSTVTQQLLHIHHNIKVLAFTADARSVKWYSHIYFCIQRKIPYIFRYGKRGTCHAGVGRWGLRLQLMAAFSPPAVRKALILRLYGLSGSGKNWKIPAIHRVTCHDLPPDGRHLPYFSVQLATKSINFPVLATVIFLFSPQ